MKSNRKSSKAEDILKKIRAKEIDNSQDQFRLVPFESLKEVLTNLKDDGTIEEDYSTTPIYQMGHEDGYRTGYAKAYSELYKVLAAIDTLIEPHINTTPE